MASTATSLSDESLKVALEAFIIDFGLIVKRKFIKDMTFNEKQRRLGKIRQRKL